MTEIKPFRAITYNQEKFQDLSRVVCPPYDIISPSQQQYYHELNPYNFIHILLGKDTPGVDKYSRAGQVFREWINDGVFVQDDKPAIYFYRQHYHVRGEKKTRVGFISLLRLGEETSSIFGHEHTRLEPKEDRLKLLSQVKANLSPIFVIFSDQKRIIQRVYDHNIKNEAPFIAVTDENKNMHELWRITAPDVLEDMQSRIRDESIFIADGHHRYEVACAYRDQMREKLGKIEGQEDFNYVMAYFTNTDFRGLTILPIHRESVRED